VSESKADALERLRASRDREKAKAEAWVRRRISEIENELLYGPPPEAPTKLAIPGFATAAADYVDSRLNDRF
jgi:hypothetical protein